MLHKPPSEPGNRSGSFSFQVAYPVASSAARLGTLTTPHGTIQTPAFIFCATKAAMKGATPTQLHQAGTQIILSNTYHLMLQPGSALIETLGGLHGFMGWNGPMLTDSGGFQLFSLGHGSVADEIKGRRSQHLPRTLIKIEEEGAIFRSYLDGSTHHLTPERAMQVQRELGADLVVMLDECTPFHVDAAYTEASMHRSHRWGMRSLTAFSAHDTGAQALYGIVQGGIYPKLRQLSAAWVHDHPFFGIAIGGSLGQTTLQMHEVVTETMGIIHQHAAPHAARPVHLLGIGGIADIIHGVQCGIDTFDCVHPTRLARHGGGLLPHSVLRGEGYSAQAYLHITHARCRHDPRPIDPTCGCETCQQFSRAYLHHLFKSRELLGLQLLTIHNIFTMNRLLRELRQAIAEGSLAGLQKRWLPVDH